MDFAKRGICKLSKSIHLVKKNILATLHFSTNKFDIFQVRSKVPNILHQRALFQECIPTRFIILENSDDDYSIQVT